MKFLWISMVMNMVLFYQLYGQSNAANYDEGKVPDYHLPDPLLFKSGKLVMEPSDWIKKREELLSVFEQEVYGKSPNWDGKMHHEILSVDNRFLGGTAIRKEIKLTLEKQGKSISMNVLIFLPQSSQKVPAFLGLNFYGNHTLAKDTLVKIPTTWIRNNEDMGSSNNRASPKGRGKRIPNWPYEEILSRGYGLITLYYGDIDPDYDDGFENGIHGLMGHSGRPDAWGSIAAWGWGLSRVMDYLDNEPGINTEKVAVLGHSRLGKAALWAGALDERFALVISNNSGCGGAALSRRKYGETVGGINTAFPHWFADNFNKYNQNETQLPIDQHQLLALMAPRPLYVASGEDDRWADPRGEFLSCVAASPVYQLFGLEGMPKKEMPGVNHPIMGTIGYHIRTGGHGLLGYDWDQYLQFADLHFGLGN
ncbi:MAG: acetylxylan esterase [Cyclobacteriaceae bacterium]